jgi:hypothetical protein
MFACRVPHLAALCAAAIASVVLLRGGVHAQTPGPVSPGTQPLPPVTGGPTGPPAQTPETRCEDPFGGTTFSATATGTTYAIARPRTGGVFRTGQDADIMLSGIGFNDTGGPLQFNHPTGIATDGRRLLLTDRFNNRVLIWTALPNSSADAPDLVLGQPDFRQNAPGTGRDGLNWPGAVAVTPTGQVVVADSYNNRLLIWTTFPTRNQQPADLVIGDIRWPWGVWSDGTRLAATATQTSQTLVWNSFPGVDHQPPSLRLTAGGTFGTPRTITSNGDRFIVGDHNARGVGQEISAHSWGAFPLQDGPADFILRDPLDAQYAWLSGAFSREGALLLLGKYLHVWPSFPAAADTPPALTIRSFPFTGGDGSSMAIGGGRVYIASYNGNRILVYNDVPDTDREPDFAIGSPDVCTNTLMTRYVVTNPVPASDGRSLIVTSDFDRRMYIWRDLPEETGAAPDVVMRMATPVWDNEIHGSMLVAAGKDTVYAWRTLPLSGEPPDLTFTGSLGSAAFRELKGVALDDRYFYVADSPTGKLWIWEGVPAEGQSPKYTWDMPGVDRLDSDGEYLAVNFTLTKTVKVFRVSEIAAEPQPYVTLVSTPSAQRFNLQMHAVVGGGMLIVSDTGFNRVHVWTTMAAAAAGRDADVVLGEASLTNTSPEIGRNKAFWPGAVAYDGTFIWMGEYKFSNRLLRFSRGGEGLTSSP